MNNSDLKNKIETLKKEKNAIILAHYYQIPEIKDVADFIGDSLALSQLAAKNSADIIVMCGVNFMGETAKILSPDKRVFIPDTNAGCSLADSCPADDFKKFIDKYPDHIVISYVNTSVEIKTLSDIVVTSSNAAAIVKSLPEDTKIIFGPDKNLGAYVIKQTGRDMVLWDGACHVHQRFSLEKIKRLIEQCPDSLLLAHPECPMTILEISDFVGSTSGILKFAKKSSHKEFIIATEEGLLYNLRNENPNKVFIPAPPNDSDSLCNSCCYMKMNTLEKLFKCLDEEINEILIEESMRKKALKPIVRMLEISEQLGL